MEKKDDKTVDYFNSWNEIIKDTFGQHNKKGLILGGYEREVDYKTTNKVSVQIDPPIKCGDFIEFTFEEDSCWGPKGTHKALISYKDGKLIANHLGDLLIQRIKSDSALYPHFDELDDLLTWCEDVKICNK